ncbi:hypothetical protein GKO28_03680 [Deefgea sp. CFH1-16]|nr:hypothetical protein [Deefgea sp. CFH1-16]
MAAQKIPLVRAYPTDEKEENVILAYLQAQQDGAQAVIGPLTKSAINYLSDSTLLTIPVLALNSFDETTLQQPNLYSFSLSVETEAAQVALLIQKNQLMRPVVLQVGDALSQRMAQGFSQEWKKVTGNEVQVITVVDARHDAALLREQISQLGADVIFFGDGWQVGAIYSPLSGQRYGDLCHQPSGFGSPRTYCAGRLDWNTLCRYALVGYAAARRL